VAPPPGGFLEVFILKGFKCCVLEVRILNGLRARFGEVRIVKEIGERRLTVDGSKSKGKERELNTETPPPPGVFCKSGKQRT
jgi:hypothetical protein